MILSALSTFVTSTATNSQVYGILDRAYLIAVSVSAIVIALLWIPIAIGFFSTDEARKTDAKLRLKNATYGTIIYVLAVSGVLYAIFRYIAVGS